MEGVEPLFLSLRGRADACIISVEKFVLCVELIMMTMMGRCLTLILLSAVVILITAGKYTKNNNKNKNNNNRERDKEMLLSGIGQNIVGFVFIYLFVSRCLITMYRFR